MLSGDLVIDRCVQIVNLLEHKFSQIFTCHASDDMIISSNQSTTKEETMDGIMTVREVIEALSSKNPDAPVMIAVIKYPDEFAIRFKDGVPTWADSTDVECIPLEMGEITTTHEGVVMLAVELEDYDVARHVAGR